MPAIFLPIVLAALMAPPGEPAKTPNAVAEPAAAAPDLAKLSAANRKILAALHAKTQLEFIDTPLQDVVDYLKDYHKIEIVFDTHSPGKAGVKSHVSVTRHIKGVTLDAALRLVLGQVGLKHVVWQEVLYITTKAEARRLIAGGPSTRPAIVLPLPPKRPARSPRPCKSR